jgi:ABC-type nitrate/sulfonate/bicarbonate transport system substrate-binding protein
LKAIGATAVASGWPVPPASAAANDPLSLGYPANVTGAVAIVAEEEKMFEKAGARVAFHKFNSGVAVRDAMVSGRVEMGIMNTTPFIIGVAKGELSGLAVAAYAGRIIMVVARKDGGVRTVADLRGKKVGSQIGSGTDHVFQNRILPAFGLKPADVQIVNVKFADHVSALASGSIEAYAGTEPYSSVAEHEGIGRIVVDYGQYDLSPIILAVNRSALQDKREAVIAMLKGWLDTVRLIQDQPARAGNAVWKYYTAQGYSAPESVFRAVLGRIVVTPDYVPELKTYMTEQAQILLDQKQISRMPDWDKELLREPIAQARLLAK